MICSVLWVFPSSLAFDFRISSLQKFEPFPTEQWLVWIVDAMLDLPRDQLRFVWRASDETFCQFNAAPDAQGTLDVPCGKNERD